MNKKLSCNKYTSKLKYVMYVYQSGYEHYTQD